MDHTQALTTQQVTEALASVMPKGSAVIQQGSLYIRRTISSRWVRIGAVQNIMQAVTMVNERLDALAVP